MADECLGSSVAQWFVVVVMPAHNEEGIADFVAEVEAHLLPAVGRLHFVVVDDASAVRVSGSELTARLTTPVSVVRNDTNLGHGPSALKAYRRGLALGADVVLHVDGDGQFRGADFPRLLHALVDCDGVVGVRVHRQEPWYRRLLSLGLRFLVAPRGQSGDINSPLRAYRSAAAAMLLESVAPTSLVPHVHWSRGHSRAGLSIAGVPVESLPRRGTSAVGTTWGPQRERQLLPPRRLVEFVGRAMLEMLRAPKPGPVQQAAETPVIEDAAS